MVGPRHISLRVYSLFLLFNGRLYLRTPQYSQKLALYCFCQSSVVTVMILRGIYPLLTGKELSHTTLLLNGKVLSHMTTYFSSLVIIRSGMHLNGILMSIDCALSFITQICLSISGTCLLVSVGLIFNPEKSGIRRSNFQSISTVLILKPLAL